MKTITVRSGYRDYNIYIENDLLNRLEPHFNSDKQYVLIADDGIPEIYLEKIKNICPHLLQVTFPRGEKSKSLEAYERIVQILIANNISKDAIIIALGGGVTGDLAGFVASTYLRGIPYIQIPTTLLAQIDSSVGGKVAVNVGNTKNVIGQIYPPLKVLIDPLALKTLEKRQLMNGMAEMIKYGMIADEDFFNQIKNENVFSDMEKYISRSVEIKKEFVEKDELDNNVRQALNFGHTFGHAIESFYDFEKYLHGEAVAIGMVRILSDNPIKAELVSVLKKYHLPTSDPVAANDLIPYILKDKKNRSNISYFVDVPKIGTFEIKKLTL